MIAQQTSRLAVLNRRKQKLIDAYLDETLSGEDVKTRQVEVKREIATATHQLRIAEQGRTVLYERLETVLEHAATLYDTASDNIKRRLNQALFEPFQIDLLNDHDQSVPQAVAEAHCTATGTLTAPAAPAAASSRIRRAKGRYCAAHGRQRGDARTGAHEKTPDKLALTGVPT